MSNQLERTPETLLPTGETRRIYVASSWRNPYQPDVVSLLRGCGHEVYDFRNPAEGDSGFHWSDVAPGWKDWDANGYLKGLEHPLSEDGFGKDFAAMEWADSCVLVLPCGRSAHLEAGWFVGTGKPLHIFLADDLEPELMYKMATTISDDINVITTALSKPTP